MFCPKCGNEVHDEISFYLSCDVNVADRVECMSLIKSVCD